MVPQWIIEKKRNGEKLSNEEITSFINGFTDGTIPDYQMAALAMAIYFRGMATQETAALTDAMLHSGEVLSWSNINIPTADKHSTGGIGDKISLPLAPLVATMDVAVPMISGRGLGITGGTLDKLESIPGYNTRLTIKEFSDVISKVGCSIIGQTSTLAPADKKLYALRDVTATVPSIPLITASIMSKKLAEGVDTLVFDVKYGRGAFMRTIEEARILQASLTATGERMGKHVSSVLSNMDMPLGRMVGNGCEVIETIEILKDNGPKDVRELTLKLALEMVSLSNPMMSRTEISEKLEKALANGDALQKFIDMVEAHGGHCGFVDKPSMLLKESKAITLKATKSGVVRDVDALKVGEISLELGCGRRRTSDAVDPTAGIESLVQIGDVVSKGDKLMDLRSADIAKAETLVAKALDAIVIE